MMVAQNHRLTSLASNPANSLPRTAGQPIDGLEYKMIAVGVFDDEPSDCGG